MRWSVKIPLDSKPGKPAQLLLDAQLRAHGLPGSASNKAGYTLVEYPTDAPRAVILRD
jgi:hypothetical protein